MKEEEIINFISKIEQEFEIYSSKAAISNIKYFSKILKERIKYHFKLNNNSTCLQRIH